MKINVFFKLICLIFVCFVMLCFSYTPVYAMDNVVMTDAEIINSYLSSDLINNTRYTIREYSNELLGSNCDISYTYINENEEYFVIDSNADDLIVNIVPKQFFSSDTNKLMIGQEYGFYINTIYDNNLKAYVSTVLVFDININANLNETIDKVITQIMPIFEYKYINLTENSTIKINGIEFKINGNGYIIPYPTIDSNFNITYNMVNDFYLNDISFSGSLFNEQYLNYGDANYDATKDFGAFFTQFDYEYDGLYYKDGTFNLDGGSELLIDDVMVVLGAMKAVPIIGNYLSGLSEIYDMISIASGNIDFVQKTIDSFINGTLEQTSHKYKAQCNYINRDEQLQNYKDADGNPLLIKNMSFKINSDKESIWYGVGNSLTGYFSINNGASNGMAPYYTRFTNELAIKIVDSQGVIKTTSIGVLTNNIYEPNIKEVNLEDEEEAYALSNGYDIFSFSFAFSSNYTITVNSNIEVILIINGKSYKGKEIIVECYVAMNDTITFTIENENNLNFIGTISITPNENLLNNNLDIGESNYIIKINDLQGVKRLDTNNQYIVISNILIFDGKATQVYSKYGNYTSSSCLDYIFTDYDCFYIILTNMSNSKINYSISITDVENIDANSQVNLKSNIYNYFTFNNLTAGNYIITLSNYANEGNNFAIRVFDFQYNFIENIKYTNEAFQFSINSNETIYIGIYSNYDESLDLVLKLSENSFSWMINGGIYEDYVTFENKIELLTGYTYNFSFLINGIISCTTISCMDNSYGVTLNIKDNSICLDENTLIGGEGIELRALYNTDISYNHHLKIVPKFNSKITDLSSFNEEDDFGFQFSVPKYVVKCDYILSVGALSQNNNIYGTIDLMSDTCKQGIKDLCMSKWNYPTDVKITISKLYVKSIYGIIEEYNCSYSSSVNNLFYSGEGTTANPYVIKYFRHFDNIRLAQTNGSIMSSFILEDNILIPKEYKYNFTTFSNFYGTFDGNNKTIYNLFYTVNPSTSEQGLFSSNYGIIKKLTIKLYGYDLKKDTTTNTYYSGSICGINYGLINQCNVLAENVNKGLSFNSYQGGICGWNSGSITNCTINVEFSVGYGNKGGIAGYNSRNGIINNCNSNGKITNYYNSANQKEVFYVGGIVGINYGSILNSVNNALMGFYCEDLVLNNKNIQPRIGAIIGLNKGTYDNVVSHATFDFSDLDSVNWTNGALWWKEEYNYDQKKYACGGICGEDDIGININMEDDIKDKKVYVDNYVNDKLADNSKDDVNLSPNLYGFLSFESFYRLNNSSYFYKKTNIINLKIIILDFIQL